MDATEAAGVIDKKQPEQIVPVHYRGSEVGETVIKPNKHRMEVRKLM